ncbi:MAG: type II secretion system F family protein [Candidatus Omnitrophica bacterium]|nr:type II secretion system F family protein [Candidatus Omnitrophota bacterium]MBU4472641.1 type II secretion system F family protein [Candidatus Omnitrophota bacterium]MCG2706736.1 type II secretion system F family protein [Candidatus Omnitrophota bacterium]
MAKFSYIARDYKNNKRITGSEEAASADELTVRLQARDLMVINVVSDSGEGAFSFKKGGQHKGATRRFRRSRITQDDLVLFCRQLATLLTSGVTILRAVDIISKQVSSRRFYNVMEELKKSMEGGTSFHEAMSKHPKVFSELWINLVDSGEASGNLATVLERLATYLEKISGFKSKVISSMMYPIILLVAGIGAFLFLTVKIVPTFAELFKSFNIALPLLTRMLIVVSVIIRKYSMIAIGSIIVCSFIFRKYIQTKEGRLRLEKFQFSLPMFGEFFSALIMERFSSGMSTLIESGVPLLYSLEITEHSVDNLVMADIIRRVKEEVREGKSLSSTLEKSQFFEPMVVQMVAVGEEVGDLPQMFKRINTFYEERVETFLGRFTSLFEPIMLIFMGLIIGVMVVGMFLPIFQLATIGGG